MTLTPSRLVSQDKKVANIQLPQNVNKNDSDVLESIISNTWSLILCGSLKSFFSFKEIQNNNKSVGVCQLV